jgi:predicted metal-dependent hydrolase
MKARRPAFDFSKTPVHWSPNPEFAQRFNASSIWIPWLERFLNRVVARALATIEGEDPATQQLRKDVRTFIRQEANHTAVHQEFTDVLKRNGYDFEEFEQYFAAEYERLFTTKSLAFLCAYCEGFETLGPASAEVWLGGELGSLTEDADESAMAMWKWHLVEEFEHRTVCYDVFKAVHGGYFLRIYGFIYQLMHYRKMVQRAVDYLMEKDRANMTPEERAASIARNKEAMSLVSKATLSKLLKVFSPFYNPRHLPEPKGYRAFMAKVEALQA